MFLPYQSYNDQNYLLSHHIFLILHPNLNILVLLYMEFVEVLDNLPQLLLLNISHFLMLYKLQLIISKNLFIVTLST
jgi:hypothetical protein